MIFQVGLNLNIPKKDVQATIDLDTGLVGFVQKTDDEYFEFTYQQSPPEFKKALLDLLLEQAAEKNHINMKISRKGKLATVFSDFSNQQGDENG